jgi:DNA-binding NtrC family response regulator
MSNTDATGSGGRFDDFVGFKVVTVLLSHVIELCGDFVDEDAVWKAFIEWVGPDRKEYFESIRRTGHSVFYYDMQSLYEFGVERTGRDDLPYLAGVAFAETAYEENLSRLLQIALESSSPFQAAVTEIFTAYLTRYTGTRYLLDAKFFEDRTEFHFANREPELGILYCKQYGLDPLKAFRNSFLYIAGAMGSMFERIISGFESSKYRVETLSGKGVLYIPVGPHDRFDFDAMTQTLVSYTRRLEDRRVEAEEEQRLESDLIAESELMWETWERIRRASRSNELLLLRGESGTGKSFYARKIHELSTRRDKPFVEVCLTSDIGSDNMIQSDLFGHEKGAFTGAGDEKKGLFQLADGGTIFLDEIGDASSELQAKLLRVMETSTFKRLGGTRDIKVDIRVIVATNRNLEKMVAEGTFRRDLYYRLNVIPLELPSLRERPEDIPVLARFLHARATKGNADAPRLDPELPGRLVAYDWPGNIRELDHAIKHAAAMAPGNVIGVSDMPAPVREAIQTGAEAAQAEQQRPAKSPKRPAGGAAPDRLIDFDSLREAVRAMGKDPSCGDENTHQVPAHVDFAKRAWLSVLIDELGGDLLKIGKLWDRGSEKTLRKTIKAYELQQRLEDARARRG